jgi:hypothetical protein
LLRRPLTENILATIFICSRQNNWPELFFVASYEKIEQCCFGILAANETKGPGRTSKTEAKNLERAGAQELKLSKRNKSCVRVP